MKALAATAAILIILLFGMTILANTIYRAPVQTCYPGLSCPTTSTALTP